ncbi:MAG TPA: DUF5906 domain-containing protein [Gemmatimonadaceae bacterium]|nr:DUF5906 domain-containing protein [Gemmatimonadaceae bacterium]
MTASDASERMMERFRGSSRGHLFYLQTGAAPTGQKTEGRYSMPAGPATVEHWRAHLAGASGLGVVPLLDDGLCEWGAIDIDDRAIDHAKLAMRLYKMELPLVVLRSKSGGAHLYLFCREPCRADIVQGKLKELAHGLGIASKVDMFFPAQLKWASARDKGSGINMPYFGGAATDRYAITASGKHLNVEDFLHYAGECAVTVDELAHVKIAEDEAAHDDSLWKGAPRSLVKVACQPGGVTDGERNKVLFKIAIYLRERFGIEAFGDKLHEYNDRFLSPPLGAREVDGIAQSVARHPNYESPGASTADDVNAGIDELNASHAQVVVGDKVAIIWEQEDGRWSLIAPSTLRAWYAHRRVQVDGEKWKPLVDVWEHSERRRRYRGIVFEPPPADEPFGQFNTWRGLTVPCSDSGSCDLFLAHLRDNVCNGDDHLYQWVLCFFADLIQRPGRKSGVTLVLLGDEGVGKTIVGRHVGFLLGDAYTVLEKQEQLLGRFNSAVARRVLIQLEEAVWAGSHQAASALKHLITSDKILLEMKGHEPVMISNYARLLITSNEQWAVPAALKQRRYGVLKVSDARKEDHAYFAAIEDELAADNNAGYGALRAFLEAYPINDALLAKVPQTDALRGQQLHSLTAEQQWFVSVLSRGMLPGDWQGQGVAQAERIYDHFIATARRHGETRRASEMVISRLLREWVPALVHRRHHIPEVGLVNVMRFPPLSETRAAFQAATGYAGPWPEDEGTPGSWTADTRGVEER